ncbi:MAG: 30S ribosomal protein S21 [Saprospiraceae bacterium]|nr:30S ribosomal protein S21 [Saprospiraceae bacterium]MCB9312207.1 30S ribosomal protein S21 [Lewinellaceae bacterium]HRW75671.1 30S ribosomal protein S21 [Saprospiraceae bacterium]
MLIVEVKDSEQLSNALKRLRRKVRDTKLIQELRRRKHFTKPSITRRAEMLKAAYIEKKNA